MTAPRIELLEVDTTATSTREAMRGARSAARSQGYVVADVMQRPRVIDNTTAPYRRYRIVLAVVRAEVDR